MVCKIMHSIREQKHGKNNQMYSSYSSEDIKVWLGPEVVRTQCMCIALIALSIRRSGGMAPMNCF